jgi:hypothetical protein
MKNINVYDNKGEFNYTIEVNDDINFIEGRVSKGNKGYYKGLGCPYKGHYLAPNEIPNERQTIIKKSDIFYMGDLVFDVRYQNIFGIIEQKYQPQFSDYIGSCGVKELSIIENSLEFIKSSVEVIKSFKHGSDQYYFLLNYRCDRKSYLQNGNHTQLYSLLEYMITNHWNFIWDKNSITDVSYNGLVTDVADIFYSEDIKHKIGTIYSILYSLSINKKKFNKFLKYCDLFHENRMSYIINTIKLLKQFGYTLPISTEIVTLDTYHDIVKNYLIEGKNCGDCSYVEMGNNIRNEYRKMIESQIKINNQIHS